MVDRLKGVFHAAVHPFVGRGRDGTLRVNFVNIKSLWTMLTETPGEVKRACVLCANEINTSEIQTDNRGIREYAVCEFCRTRTGLILFEHDPSGDLGCRRRNAYLCSSGPET